MTSPPRPFPSVWGHRGASAEYPENTLAAFRGAIREGAHGIESDVHLTRDGRIVLFHDAVLSRTSTGTGLIGEQDWEGEHGIQHVTTVQAPHQHIPLMEELLELLCLPGNEHVSFNIDVKPSSDPYKIFPVMATLISLFPPSLQSRLILGLWHPAFILPSLIYLPFPIKRWHIGASIPFAKKHFWSYVDGFSMLFDVLVDGPGQKFRKDCAKAGKQLGVWTVNCPKEMAIAADWEVAAILTDKPLVSLDLKARLATPQDRLKTFRELGLNTWTFPWLNKRYWNIYHTARAKEEIDELERDGGKVDSVAPLPPPELLAAYLDKLRSDEKSRTPLKKVSVSLVPDIHDATFTAGESLRTAGVRA